MTLEMDPRAAAAMQQATLFSSLLDQQLRRINTASVNASDEAKTVTVTIDGHQCLTGLHFEEGVLRLGADEVSNRINEAIETAKAVLSTQLEVEQNQLLASLADIAQQLDRAEFG